MALSDSYRSLPKSPGVYIFKNAADEIIYVGKALSLRDRVSSYFHSGSVGLLPKTAKLVSNIKKIDYVLTESEIDALILEANLVRRYQPHFNIALKDGKSYPLIAITIKDKVPKVILVRHENFPGAVYFGPFPPGSDVFGLLRYLRRIFPFVSQNHPGNKPCLRSHLGLCPCPDIFTSALARSNYRHELRNLIAFLSGKRTTIQKQLKRDMQKFALKQNFEKAAEIKNKLMQIEAITAPRHQAWEYETNPNLTDDKAEDEVKKLAGMLNLPSLSKIECYDISNLSGKNATGAQVVFVNGLPVKNLYRRYRIRSKSTPDDFAMLQEMLRRRFKSDIPLPELLVIDGGKGQLSSITKIISTLSFPEIIKRPMVISLAKRLETIYTDDDRTIQLDLNDPALHLLQKLRDEAHRFSRKYHFLLRSKEMLG